MGIQRGTVLHRVQSVVSSSALLVWLHVVGARARDTLGETHSLVETLTIGHRIYICASSRVLQVFTLDTSGTNLLCWVYRTSINHLFGESLTGFVSGEEETSSTCRASSEINKDRTVVDFSSLADILFRNIIWAFISQVRFDCCHHSGFLPIYIHVIDVFDISRSTVLTFNPIVTETIRKSRWSWTYLSIIRTEESRVTYWTYSLCWVIHTILNCCCYCRTWFIRYDETRFTSNTLSCWFVIKTICDGCLNYHAKTLSQVVTRVTSRAYIGRWTICCAFVYRCREFTISVVKPVILSEVANLTFVVSSTPRTPFRTYWKSHSDC